MSNYYCPNCDADLEDQIGFSSYDDYFHCENCGTWLVSPDHNDSSERFPNTCWICDSCNELLNTQYGFSDWNNTWTCTNCGYENKISDNEIYKSEEEYEQRNAEGSGYSMLGKAIGILGLIGISKLLNKKNYNNEEYDEDNNEDEDEDEEYDNTFEKSCYSNDETKLIKLKCDNCNAVLDVDINKMIAYCPYCGQKLLIDNNTLFKEKEKTKRKKLKLIKLLK